MTDNNMIYLNVCAGGGRGGPVNIDINNNTFQRQCGGNCVLPMAVGLVVVEGGGEWWLRVYETSHVYYIILIYNIMYRLILYD